ncbi:MAG: ABC transporter permease [Planctomycetota bacterium]
MSRSRSSSRDDADARRGPRRPVNLSRPGFLNIFSPVERIGDRVLDMLDHIGSVVLLTVQAAGIVAAALGRQTRIGRSAIVNQIVRVGVRSVFIVSLVSGAVGLILALNMAPPLEQFGSKDLVANIIGVAVLRELGPLMAAIVLTGFAGAAIAAEIGTMVVGEEIEALEVHALNPVRFLIVPRVIATVLSMLVLGVISNVMAIGVAMLMSQLVLGIPFQTYWDNMLFQVTGSDFWTGMIKAGIFGLLIGSIACTNGLKVTGGAAGVGRATTNTVVQCVVSIVIADTLFTAIFYIFDLN